MVEFEPIAGRYMTLEIEGRRCRIHVEEAGQGIPLICLHTAGADSRQFRHLMCDAAITERFRVIAFDMPFHGKSSPWAGYQDEEYRLTASFYAASVLAVVDALDLERPAVIGCSMGAQLALILAGTHPDRFRAVVGLEASEHRQPWYDADWLHRPDVHGGEVAAALVSGLVAPQSPDDCRWETLWAFQASGPGVLRGDLNFCRHGADLRDRVHMVDTTRCAVFLLTGEYDFSCTPADTLRMAKDIPGVEAEIMEELGHFPMSENPERFRRYILPVLDKVALL